MSTGSKRHITITNCVLGMRCVLIELLALGPCLPWALWIAVYGAELLVRQLDHVLDLLRNLSGYFKTWKMRLAFEICIGEPGMFFGKLVV